MKHGEFSELADTYSSFRAGYSPFVLDTLIGRPVIALAMADVCAGTGIRARLWQGPLIVSSSDIFYFGATVAALAKTADEIAIIYDPI